MPIDRVVAIVDAYSSGRLLAEEFVRCGYRCVMVQSTPDVPAAFFKSFHPEQFVRVIRHTGDVARTAAELTSFDPLCVIPGCELGVELADALAERLALPGNGTGLSAARRDKGLMGEAVRRCGLRTAAQCASDRLIDIRDWVQSHATWPVIVKPTRGCGSDGVYLCRCEAEVERAFAAILGQPNMLGFRSEAVLAQEYLAGVEYVVDTVSWAGRHRVAAFWQYHRPPCDSSFVCYDAMELLPYEGRIQQRLFVYARDVLDALGIRYGPAHCEIMWSGGEPVLVEVAARLSAGNNAVLGRMCGGACALDLTVLAYTAPDQFTSDRDPPREFHQHALNCFLMPRREGRLRAIPDLSRIESLPSFHTLSWGARPGQPLPRVAAVVTLLHPDRDQIGCDLRRIRELEQTEFYQVA